MMGRGRRRHILFSQSLKIPRNYNFGSRRIVVGCFLVGSGIRRFRVRRVCSCDDSPFHIAFYDILY